MDLLRVNTLRGTKTAILSLKARRAHPRPFYIGVPPDWRYRLSIAFLRIDWLKAENFESSISKSAEQIPMRDL